MTSLLFLGPVLLSVCLLLYKLSKVGSRPKNLPPGPPTLPLIGNLHLMPKNNPHLQFQKWAEEYGPIYSLMLGAQTLVVLNTDQAVKDLLDKRSNIYSSRPEMYLGSLVGSGMRMVLMPYGPTWRMIHRIFHSILNINTARAFIPYQDLENKQMLTGFLNSPENFIDHIRRYSNSLTTQMVFGFRTYSIDDPKLKQLFHGVHLWSQVVGSEAAALLDLYPILRNIPAFLMPMKKHVLELQKNETALYIGHWLDAKAKLAKGTLKPCFCVDLIKAQKTEGFSDLLAGYISGTLLEAGSDTTAAELVGFVQAMVLFPAVQQVAREELDRVVGPDRLPTMEDDLPYIRCCVKEAIRWMPTAILGLHHAVIRDDEYMGYKIPKGAAVMLNVWTINMDPKRQAHPRVFDPSRFMADHAQTAAEAAVAADPARRDHFTFGAGRRLCQGMHIAERSMFLAIARLLWGFEFRRATEAAGREVLPDPDNLTQGFLVQPRPFPARIVPRSEAHARLVREAWDDCQDLLDEELQWKETPKGMPFSTLAADAEDEKGYD